MEYLKPSELEAWSDLGDMIRAPLEGRVKRLRDALEKIESMSSGRIGPVHSSYADVQRIAADALKTN